MKLNQTTRYSVRAFTVAALKLGIVLMVAACGGNPVPAPAPPAGNGGYGGGIGLGNCGGVTGVQPVQVNGVNGYYADLVSPNPTSSGDIFVSMFYQQVPVVGYQAVNVVGAGAIKIPALTGYFQNSVIPICVSSNNNSPGQLNAASGGVKIKMTGPLPTLPQGAIPGGMVPNGYPYGYMQTQSMGNIEVRIGWSCPAWIAPQGRVIGCIDVISYGYPGGSMSYQAQ